MRKQIELKPIVRRSIRLLAAVHELHKQGHQDLAIYTGMSPSGFYWRCSLVPFNRVLYDSAELKMYEDYGVEQAIHSSGKKGNDYFGWNDAEQDNARELADKIKQRFPRLLASTLHSNYEYAGWYTEMLGIAEKGHLPIMFHDYLELGDLKSFPTTTKSEYIASPPHESLWEFKGKKFTYKNAPHLEKGDDWHTAYCKIIGNWRSSDIAYLPKYPVHTQDHSELGAYWEGAIYYIQEILGYHRIDSFLESLEYFERDSERWQTFHKVWNNNGQLEFLKAFFIRSMLNDENKYKLNRVERSDYQAWLKRFEQTYIPYGKFSQESLPANPYFGGNNPLHLGMIFNGYRDDCLIKI